MISHVRGKITETGQDYAVIETGGIGYHIRVPAGVAASLAESARTKPDTHVRVLTHMVLREDSVSLYGFLHPHEREMFRLLLAVNRVGPALALAILSTIAVPDIAGAIISGDEGTLTRVPGIGKKGAQRLIVELRDRMKERAELVRGIPGVPAVPARAPAARDAIEALQSLGFSPRESEDAVVAVTRDRDGQTVQAIIRSALSRLREGA